MGAAGGRGGGEVVYYGDIAAVFKEGLDEVGADEACAAGDEGGLVVWLGVHLGCLVILRWRILRCAQNDMWGLRMTVIWLPGQDSNLGQRIQSPLCYRCTTGQRGWCRRSESNRHGVAPNGV